MIYYAGIGSRNTPLEVIYAFEYLGEELAKRGYILRSGGANGADKAFEKGCDKASGKKEIYLPWRKFNGNESPLFQISEEAFSIAAEYHPAYNNLSVSSTRLMARNSYQILGNDLNTLSSFVICYTQGGTGAGGTGQALRIAKDKGIKICDFGRFPKEKAIEYANKILKEILKKYPTIEETIKQVPETEEQLYM